MEAAQTAALALIRLRDGDSLSGLHAHLLQVGVPPRWLCSTVIRSAFGDVGVYQHIKDTDRSYPVLQLDASMLPHCPVMRCMAPRLVISLCRSLRRWTSFWRRTRQKRCRTAATQCMTSCCGCGQQHIR